MNDKEGTSEFSGYSVCTGCQEKARVNANHLCAACAYPAFPVDPEAKEGYLRGNCRACGAPTWIDPVNLLCSGCTPGFSEHERNAARFFQKELPQPTIINKQVIDDLTALGTNLSKLEVKFLRRAVAMETMRKMLAEPTRHSIYDLFQGAWGGGYNLNLNFTEREDWK